MKEESWRIEFCRKLPKAELHAHLHGSVKVEDLMELAESRNAGHKELELLNRIRNTKERALEDCFRLFGMVHALVTDKDALRFITKRVLQDFVDDNVVYLELRSTPRETKEISCQEYIETVAEIVNQFQRRNRIIVRLLISMNRANGIAEARRMLDIVLSPSALSKEARQLVVGIDFSGNPTHGSFEDFESELQRARDAGLKITIHCGEVDNEKEVDAIIRFHPERLGHCLRLSEGAGRILTTNSVTSIPIECCPTSNCKTLELENISGHPWLLEWLKNDYPFSVCTDDSGIFKTSLSQELAHVGDSLGLSREELKKLSLAPFQFAFVEQESKAKMLELAAWSKV